MPAAQAFSGRRAAGRPKVVADTRESRVRPAYEIRRELPADHAAVEALTRRAFWDVHVPGCSEHFLVHRMRSHADFVAELALVLEVDGRLVGSILYTRARLVDGQGREKPVLTFGRAG
jgi:predicted N-acetyltransferase YhbS